MAIRSVSVAVSAVTLSICLWSGSAQAGFCTGKANGWWCDGGNLVVCQNGSVVSSENCPCGCQSMPPGQPDQCNPCSGFCSNKANGWWCDGNKLVVCQNGAKVSSETCACGCQSMPPGVPDQCAPCGGFCSDKANGYWCDGDDLVVCQNGSETSSEYCACGCQSMPPGQPDECASCGFCSGKGDGYWCDGDTRVQCIGGQQTASVQCEYGCSGDGGQAVCEDPPPQGFCSDKANGYWCDEDTLVLCQDGDQVSATVCTDGCVSMPPGQPDECADPSPPGFCDGKSNGWWCDGDTRIYCSGGQQDAIEPCEYGCTGSGGQAVCEDPPLQGFCLDKADGFWCDGSTLVNCQLGQTVGETECTEGCISMPPGTPDECAPEDEPPVGFCQGKADGHWCQGNTLVLCQGGQEVSGTECPEGCVSMPPGQPDECADPTPQGFCADSPDGWWCNGDTLVECQGQVETASQVCTNGCVSMPPGIPDVCQGEPGLFCQGKDDGYWCNGDLLALCSGGQAENALACANGCVSMPPGVDDQCKAAPSADPDGQLLTVTNQGGCGAFFGDVDLWSGTGLPAWNQKDYDDDQLGTCPGLTIKSSGCLITSFAMLYGYMGVERSVGGDTGSSPPIEDAWRSVKVNDHCRGYAQDTYEYDGETVSGDCLAYFDTNPAGVGLQYHYNVMAGCIEYNAALAIATSLNSGMPVVAGVHWQSGKEDQHWVLIIGADNNGVILVDPWGGKTGVRLETGKLGSYTIDTFFTSYLVGGIGGPGESSVVIDDTGQPLAPQALVSRLPEILEEDEEPIEDQGDLEQSDAGQAAVDSTDEPDQDANTPDAGEVKTQSSGCSTTGPGTRSTWPALLVLLLLMGVAAPTMARRVSLQKTTGS